MNKKHCKVCVNSTSCLDKNNCEFAASGSAYVKLESKYNELKKQTKGAMVTKKKQKESVPSFLKPLTPSPLLAKLIGEKRISRTEAVKKTWEYVKKHKLIDKRNIHADEKLKPLFNGKDIITIFELAKILSKNLT